MGGWCKCFTDHGPQHSRWFFSAAEYCAPVWLACTHTQHIDVALNKSLRVITDSVSSTPVEWLSVLPNMEPPEIRRTKAFLREWEKQENMDELPIHIDLNDLPVRRLESRKPSQLTVHEIDRPHQPDWEWKNIWHRASVHNNELVVDPTLRQAGFHIPRKAWVRFINRMAYSFLS